MLAIGPHTVSMHESEVEPNRLGPVGGLRLLQTSIRWTLQKDVVVPIYRVHQLKVRRVVTGWQGHVKLLGCFGEFSK